MIKQRSLLMGQKINFKKVNLLKVYHIVWCAEKLQKVKIPGLLLTKYAVYNSKKSRFMKEQEASGIIRNITNGVSSNFS